MSKSTTLAGDAVAGKTPRAAVSPRKLAHVVLRTKSNFDVMVKWYCVVLGAKIVFNAGRLIFLSYDDEHHRIAIAASEELAERPPRAAGLDHIAFTYDDIDALLATYARLKRAGNSTVGLRQSWPDDLTLLSRPRPEPDRIAGRQFR